ncbi:Uncharacterized protein ChrSV_3752 [Chromobacterium vaccinii]|nr:Uncharacterized protein ChrSW_3752 [Chromobacterium vaccinii]QND91209.1 Uncharacterized protein ChrSV_3752 [Chromobacterium vaccinii]
MMMNKAYVSIAIKVMCLFCNGEESVKRSDWRRRRLVATRKLSDLALPEADP